MRDRLQIGEFSVLGHVSVRMLRHYEKLGLLKPAAIDPFTSYRYYTLEQLPRLNRIIALKELGFSLEQVGDILSINPTAEEMHTLLNQRRAILVAEIERSSHRLAQVDMRLAQIEREGIPLEESDVILKSLPASTVASVRAIVPSVEQVSDYCHEHFRLIAVWLSEQGIAASGHTMNLYHMDEYSETDLDMESVMIVAPTLTHGPSESTAGGVAIRRLAEAPRAASLVMRSGFTGIEDGVMTLLGWIAASGLEVAGPLREVHLFGHPDIVDVAAPAVLELVVPVKMRTG